MTWAPKELFPTTNWDPSGGTNTTRVAVGTVAVAVGDTIIVVVPYRIVGDTTITVADNLGNTYTERTTPKWFNAGDANSGVRFFDSDVTVAGTPTVTATAASACSYFGCFARSYSGLTTTAYQASVAALRSGSSTTGTDAEASSPVSISLPPVLVLGVCYQPAPANSADLAVGTGFANKQSGRKSNGLADYIIIEDKRLASGSSTTATFTAAQAGNTIVKFAAVYSELSTDPVITGGAANPVHLSTGNTVTGVNFGSNTGSAALTIGGQAQTVTGWTSTTITYTANRGVNLDDVAVNAVVTNSAGVASGSYALTGFDPPSGYYYVTLASVNTTAAYRITAAGDLAIGNQIEWDNALVTVYNDGTYVADPSVTSFNVRAGVTTDGWGSLAVQNINVSAASSSSKRAPLRIGMGFRL